MHGVLLLIVVFFLFFYAYKRRIKDVKKFEIAVRGEVENGSYVINVLLFYPPYPLPSHVIASNSFITTCPRSWTFPTREMAESNVTWKYRFRNLTRSVGLIKTSQSSNLVFIINPIILQIRLISIEPIDFQSKLIEYIEKLTNLNF